MNMIIHSSQVRIQLLELLKVPISYGIVPIIINFTLVIKELNRLDMVQIELTLETSAH